MRGVNSSVEDGVFDGAYEGGEGGAGGGEEREGVAVEDAVLDESECSFCDSEEREGGEGSQLSKREDAVGDCGVAILWLAHARDSGSAGERRRGGDVRGESVHETDFHPSLDERTFL